MELDNVPELNSVKDRILFFLKYKNLSQAKFEKMTKLSNGYVNNIVNTISNKTFNNKIAPVFPELNKYWVLYNEMPMLNSDKTEVIIDKNIKDLPHGEQMEMLLNEIKDLKDIVIKIKERDKLYFESIAAKLGIGKIEVSNDQNKNIAKKNNSN